MLFGQLDEAKLSQNIARYLGTSFGTFISIPTSGLIAGSLGWEAVFYIHGSLAIIWCVLWVVFVTDDTQKHPFMSEEEKTFIRENHANAKKDPAKEGEPKVQYFFEIK